MIRGSHRSADSCALAHRRTAATLERPARRHEPGRSQAGAPEFIPQLESAIAGYRDRLLVRPGLTGLAQVQLPPDTDLASVRRKLACDLYYVHRFGFWLDVKILVATVFHVLHVPFAVAGCFLGVPSGEPVERAYQDILATAENAQQRPAMTTKLSCG